jgi:hypothetical protein
MRRARILSIVYVGIFASVANTAIGQVCPPRPGLPANWCAGASVAHGKWQGPGIPPNNFNPKAIPSPPPNNFGSNFVPNYGPPPSPGYTPSPPPNNFGVPAPPGYTPSPPPNNFGVPAPPGNFGSPPGYNVAVVPPGPYPASYQIQCFVDQINFCTFDYPAPVPSGTQCHCGNYPGITP